MTGSLRLIGTATTLLSYGGITILTDPNFLHRGQKAYLGKGMWSTGGWRRTPNAICTISCCTMSTQAGQLEGPSTPAP